MPDAIPPIPPQTAQPHGAVAAKKGLPWWAWTGIGCGCLLIVLFVAFVSLVGFGVKKVAEKAEEFENDPAAAVEMIIGLNPDLEVVESDRETGKITIRDTSTGEVATFDYSDIQNGNFSFETAEGRSTISTNAEEGRMTFEGADGEQLRIGTGVQLDDLPPWLPLYPETQVNGGMTQTRGGTYSGLVSQLTTDGPDAVEDFYQSFFDDEGWTVERSTMSTADGRVVVLSASEGERSMNVTIATGTGTDEGRTAINFQYEGPEG